MNNKPTIDITQKVMSQIKDQDITVRPRWQFAAIKASKVVLAVVLVGIIIASISALVYTLNHEMFKDYLELGRTGTIDYLKTIPWAGIVIVVASVVGLFWLASKKNLFKQNLSLVAVLGSLFIVVVIGVGFGLKSSNSVNSLPSKLANSYRGGNQPLKIEGKIIGREDNVIIVESGGKQYKITYKNGTQFVNGNPTEGDKVLILGFEKDGVISVEAVKLVARAEAVKSENPVTTPAPEQPAVTTESPKTSAPNTVPTKPNQSPAPVSPTAPPAPSVDSMLITLNNSGNLFKWKTNYIYDGGYKLVWSKNPGATYPGRNAQDTYFYNSNPSANPPQLASVSSFDGPGIYYVRVCGLNAAHVCIKYSAEINVSLP